VNVLGWSAVALAMALAAWIGWCWYRRAVKRYYYRLGHGAKNSRNKRMVTTATREASPVRRAS